MRTKCFEPLQKLRAGIWVRYGLFITAVPKRYFCCVVLSSPCLWYGSNVATFIAARFASCYNVVIKNKIYVKIDVRWFSFFCLEGCYCFGRVEPPRKQRVKFRTSKIV